ncbi:MAG TPA: AbrB/MazE/SpoVT family DNA-binding domain-containing protein [archaeon]|nr:AbrB/MazE/SpoVT family DNA-binding domain-containing protein [archaeon]
MAIEVTIKKWGNSKGAIFPKEFLEKQGIKENDTVLLEVVKKMNLSKVFGSAPKRTMSGQKFKDMVRKGWD